MRNPRRILLLLLLVLVAAVLWFKPGSHSSSSESIEARQLYPGVSSLIRENYVDLVQPEKAFAGAYNGIMRELDSFSAYIPPHHQITDKNLRMGRGYWAGIWIHPINRHFEVARLEPDSHAGQGSLKVGDRIESVNGFNLTRLTFHLARLHLYTATPGEFKLTVLSRDQQRSRRLSIPATILRSGRGPRLLKNKAVYLSLAWMDAESTRLLSRDISRWRSRSWIIDLRGYQSGDLSSCLSVADLLLSPTNQLELRTRMGSQRLRPGSYQKVPLHIAALVGPTTIMYGEILATLMKESGVILVGSATGGYNAHLKRAPLPDGGIALITDGHFFWKGKPIQNRPVQPQLLVKPNQDPLDVALRALEES